MKISIKELQKYLNGDWSLEDVIHTLNIIGFPIDNIKEPSKYLKQLRIAVITEKKSHPINNDLGLLTVEYLGINKEKQTTQVVCGDTNLIVGNKAILILTGETLPSTEKKLKPRLISGVESGGMLCSGDELGLDNNYDGVYTVDAALDADVTETLFNQGAILDVEVTYNRGDLLSCYGLARELASVGLGTLNALQKPTISFKQGNIKIDTDQCSFYSLNYTNATNNLVDLSNQIAFEIGQPTHVFDAEQIVGTVYVRLSTASETFVDLHNKAYTIPEGLLVIADSAGILAIAGVIGGLRASFTANTTKIAIEIACFSKDAVLKASQALNINTDAAKFFTHGVDPMNVLYAIAEYEKALQQKFESYTSTGELAMQEEIIVLEKHLAQKLCASLWDEGKFIKALHALGFQIENQNTTFSITIPTFRQDIDCPQVLIGEYLRFIGYTNLSNSYVLTPAKVCLEADKFDHLRTVLSTHLNEIKTFKLISKPDSKLLINPITGYNALRDNLIENVLTVAIDNYKENRIFNGVYEIGDVFDVEQLTQTKYVCVVLKGLKKIETIMEELQLKLCDVLHLLNLDPTKIKYENIEDKRFIEGVAANITYKREIIGKIGALTHDLKSNVGFVGFELNLYKMDAMKKLISQSYKPMQNVFTKDFSFKLTSQQHVSTLLETLQKNFPTIEFSVFDVYPENYLVERNVGIRAVSAQEIDQVKIEAVW